MAFEPVMTKAGGAIYISSFIKRSTSANQTALQAADSTVPLLGISTEAAHDAPIPSNSNTTLAAVSAGDMFKYYPVGAVCRLKCSGGWTAGDQIVPTTNGAGATVSGATTAKFIGAIAEETVNDGEYGLVTVVNYAYTAT